MKLRRRRLILALFMVFLMACTPSPTTAVPPPGTAEGQVSIAPRDVHQTHGGKWYPADPTHLRRAVQNYIDGAITTPISGTIEAVVVPHASYVFSGAVAGYAFRLLRDGGCDGHTVVVIGDSHTGNGTATVAVWASGAFETPLGLILVDEQVAQKIVEADPRIAFDRKAFREEHPVENQIPFIQVACHDARIVPVVLRDHSPEAAHLLADALVAALEQSGRPSVIVASTDLSHYHPYDEARRIDQVALQAIVSMDPQQVIDSPDRCTGLGIAESPLTMCSPGAVMTAMIVARQRGANAATVLRYANSGDTPFGERDRVVGYGAVALWRSGTPISTSFTLPPLPPAPPRPLTLSPAEQRELLDLARRTIACFLGSETFPPYHTDDPGLLQPLGAYVTYRRRGALRGCLGRLIGDRPVYLNVQYAAVMAALKDPRFPPVTADELKELNIEVTVLHPIHEVKSPDEIQVGRDGVLMHVGKGRGALFLPQVASEQGWSREELLVHLCRKAGLPDDAWQRSDASFYTFGGQWFAEEGER